MEETKRVLFDTKRYKVLIVEDKEDEAKNMINDLNKIKYVESYAVYDFDVSLSILKNDHTFDVLVINYDEYSLVDYIKRVRMYNSSIFVLLLLDEDSNEPSIELLERYNIQGCCNRKKGYEELKIWVHSAIRMLEQTKMLKQLYIQTKNQSNAIKDLNSKIEENYYATMDILRKAVDKKDPYTRGHSDRVGYLSALIAQELGMSDEEIEVVKIGGFFHDIGKIGVKDNILTKTDHLTDEEYEEIKKHPLVGYDLLESNDIFVKMLPMIRNHHERYDGKGYPDGLKGDDIPLGARIVSIADAFDAMMSKRSYRDKLDINTVINEIASGKGTQFDPRLADVFMKLLIEKSEQIKRISGDY